MMLRGLWKLTWIELKVFLREPLGALGTIVIPVLVFIVAGRILGRGLAPNALAASSFISVGLPVLASVMFRFTIALLISTWSILSIGFLIASIVPTARFAQPIGAFILYPMIALSGLFAPVESLPPSLHAVARVMPLTYAVSLLEGIWKGDDWWAHVGDVGALAVVFIVCTALSAKVFRWQ
jgi:ABC-2 type transport system permease protein